ncbi:hypothetical protein ACN2WE_40520 [Streptomyces sp. cg28]|uniref:hypothetical protein n=1 Tax=Streptomyces sp. cg28 TaxID=3403457 RepID=UPI003B20D7EF
MRFDVSGSDAQKVLHEQLLGLIEDITPVYQPHPADHSADLDVTGALTFFGRTLAEIAAMLQLRAIALHGVRVTIGGGRSRTQPVRTFLQSPNEKLACGRHHFGGEHGQFAGSRDMLPVLGECE